ncbi:MAG: hypothetical protein Q4D76_09920 [Oscillospiraceae bacterium]|nr:hypothetical protein [Oscillospiraceae bacterium]
MKAYDTPTKKQKARLSQAIFQDSLDTMSDNLAATLIVLHEYFGFGEKRIRDFLENTSKVVKEFKDYGDEELAREKFSERLRDAGIEFSEIYFNEDIILSMQQQKKEKQSAVSIKEAQEMRTALSFMKSLM